MTQNEEQITNWPLEYAEKLIISNKESNVAVATLWTMKEFVASVLDPKDYCLVANFYDAHNGIEPLIRNCLGNPKIRYILLIGNDRAKSKNTLINFFSKPHKEHIVTNTNVELPTEIPLEYINKLVENIKLIDLTDQITNLDDQDQYKAVLSDVITTLPKLEPFDIPRVFPKKKIIVETMPSNIVYKIDDDFVSTAWLKVLKHLKTFGKITQTTQAESSKVKECINIITVINSEDPDDPNLKEYMRFSKSDLESYYESFTTPYKPIEVAYTYGSRFFGNDQFKRIEEILIDNIFSKRCYATTWEMEDLYKENPPCVISIQPNVQGSKLFMTCYIRSNDMFRAWPLNAFGLRKIQKNLVKNLNKKFNEEILKNKVSEMKILSEIKSCDVNNSDNFKNCNIDSCGIDNIYTNSCNINRYEIDCSNINNSCNINNEPQSTTDEDMLQMGSLTIISHSAHVYNENWKEMDKILSNFYKFEPSFIDPTGYYIIEIVNNEILVKHFDSSGKQLREFKGKSSNEVFSKLVQELLTDDKFHLVYLGKEIGKAEICLKNGLDYVQDQDIFI